MTPAVPFPASRDPGDHPGAYERSQLAGIAHLLAISREQAAARGFPPTLPLPACPDPGDQIAQLEAEAAYAREAV